MFALISKCTKYRYYLSRRLSDSPKTCLFIMLNPSTADHQIDDPTITRCQNYARKWGYGRLVVVNLFAFRATNPKEMISSIDPIGPHTVKHVERVLRHIKRTNGLVVCAWGTHGQLNNQNQRILDLIKSHDLIPYCLKATKNNHPNHPLYLRGDLLPIPLN